jgi:hypothetical protein
VGQALSSGERQQTRPLRFQASCWLVQWSVVEFSSKTQMRRKAPTTHTCRWRCSHHARGPPTCTDGYLPVSSVRMRCTWRR